MWRAIPLVMLFAAPTCGMRAPGAAHVRIVSRVCLRAAVAMGKAPDADTEEALYPKYIKERKDSGEDVDGVYSDLGVESDFDGGDSGSGAVGDGQVTLDNQHDSPFLVGGGGLRDSIEGMAAMNSNSKYDDVPDEGADGNSVEGATSARDSKQKNYWGRQIGTGYADELAKKGLYEDRPVLRQQLENWQNQQALKTATDAQTDAQTMFFGSSDANSATDWKKSKGRPIDQLRSEITNQNVGPVTRLDGAEWGEATLSDKDEFEETYEMYGTPSVPGVLEIEVLNEISAFAPFHVSMTADSPKSMSVTPTTGVMEKRFSEKAVELIVRFTPDAYGIPVIGTLIFETEDFRKVFKIVGKTAN